MKVKRIIFASVIAVTVVAAVAAGTAWGSPGPSSAVITFDDVNQQVTLQIPDPPCDATEPNCVWKFFLNEPKVSVDVAIVYGLPGQSGTLTIRYPTNFCGIIQADAYVGPSMAGPWVPKRGWQHQIVGTCDTPTPPSGGGSSTPPPDEPPSEPPPSAPAPVNAPAPNPTTALPETQAAAVTPAVAAATAAPSTPTTTAPTSPAAAMTSLPFTGADLKPFIVLGLTFVTLGLGLLARRRKRTL